MFDGLAGFITAITTSAQGKLLLAVATAMLVYAAYQYMFGNQKEGKSLGIAVLFGAAVVLLAPTIVATITSLAHA